MSQYLVSDVIEAIANSKDKEPDELEIVLHDHIDVDALENLAKHGKSTWRIQFELPRHVVTVTSSGQILVDDQFKQNWGGD